MRRNMKWIVGGALLALVIACGLVYASPYMTVQALRKAAENRDAEGVTSRVDFPALRSSIKADLGARLTAELRRNPNDPMASIGMLFGATLANQLVDAFLTPENIAVIMRGRVPDPAVTVRNALPFGLSSDFTSGKNGKADGAAPGAPGASDASGQAGDQAGLTDQANQAARPGENAPAAASDRPRAGKMDTDMGYEGVNRFVVRLRGGSDKPDAQPVVLEFRRDGLFSWKLCGMRLPK